MLDLVNFRTLFKTNKVTLLCESVRYDLYLYTKLATIYLKSLAFQSTKGIGKYVFTYIQISGIWERQNVNDVSLQETQNIQNITADIHSDYPISQSAHFSPFNTIINVKSWNKVLNAYQEHLSYFIFNVLKLWHLIGRYRVIITHTQDFD